MSALEFFFYAFVFLFVIIDPVSCVPIFLGMTPNDSPIQRARMVKVACAVTAVVLLFFAVTGMFIFSYLGITLHALQVAGGILLFVIGFDMLMAREAKGKLSSGEAEAGRIKDDVAVTPLAIPLLAGPGAISAVVILQGQAKGWGQAGLLYLALALVLVASYLILRISCGGATQVPPLVMQVVRRISGLILAALSVQFILDGLRESRVFIEPVLELLRGTG